MLKITIFNNGVYHFGEDPPPINTPLYRVLVGRRSQNSGRVREQRSRIRLIRDLPRRSRIDSNNDRNRNRNAYTIDVMTVKHAGDVRACVFTADEGDDQTGGADRRRRGPRGTAAHRERC
uniref:Uncharacterized protein n=1 Tax=Sipha flava TaxID=143950 RepID=A0A2S2Q6I2_9HEMI